VSSGDGSAYAAPYSSDDRGRAVYSNLVKLQKNGHEYYTLMPPKGADFILSGRYYLMVVSEGQSPSSTSRIGAGGSFAQLTSHGEAGIHNLGLLGIGQQMVRQVTYDAGEVGLVEFELPANTQALEVKLIDRTGSPKAFLEWVNASETNENLRFAKTDAYGLYSSEYPDKKSFLRYTIGNPVAGKYRLVISDPEKYSPASGSYTLVVSSIIPQILQFSDSDGQNGGGGANQASGSLSDDERAFYQVDIPSICSTNPTEGAVLGWRLEITSTSGNPEIRVTSENLPTDISANGDNLTEWARYSAVVAPEELYSGTWYVEVKGVGSLSDYTITSSPVMLERGLWQMPKPGEVSMTPGVSAPNFADTGVDEAGNALSDDQGVDLAKGLYHFYAIEIPEGNGGLLRAQLEAISGNPDLYIRRGFIPTIDHKSNNKLAYQFQLNQAAQTEYGNFVPKDGKKETQLAPGIWYLAVKASGDQSARYRLKLSLGQVDLLDVDGGILTGQSIVSGDIRYYQVLIPDDPKLTWTLQYSASVGDVEMFIRDTLPPGEYQSGTSLRKVDWGIDRKNNEVPSASDIKNPGTYTFGHPALRPGSTYYVGIRGKIDSTFTLSSSSGTDSTIESILDLAFDGGTLGLTDDLDIAVGEIRYYKVDVPAHAVKWVHRITRNPNQLEIRIEQGSLPSLNGGAHYASATRTSYSKELTSWPWVPGQTYYIGFENIGGQGDENVTFTLNGETALTYSLWANESGLPTDPDLADQDNDGNGIVDLLDYALWPLGGSSSIVMSETITHDDGSRSLKFNIPDEIRSGKRILIEYSQDLNVWTTLATKKGMDGANQWDSRVTIKETDRGPYREVVVDFPEGSAGKSFMRVNVLLE